MLRYKQSNIMREIVGLGSTNQLMVVDDDDDDDDDFRMTTY